MKILLKITLLFAAIVVGIGAYTHFVVAPDEMSLSSNAVTNYANTGIQRLWMEKNELKFNLGSTSLFGGILITLIGIFLLIKLKSKLAILVLILGLIAFYFGAAHATHMFS